MRNLALIMNPDGTPATIELAARPSGSAPNRLKAVFVLDVQEGTYVTTGDGKAVAVAQPPGKTPLGGEFRIEIG